MTEGSPTTSITHTKKKEYGYELYNIWIRICIPSLYNNVNTKKTNKKQTKRHKAKIYNFAHSPRMLKVNAMKS